MVCPACQSAVNNLDRFCPYCGWELKEHPLIKELKKESKKYWKNKR